MLTLTLASKGQRRAFAALVVVRDCMYVPFTIYCLFHCIWLGSICHGRDRVVDGLSGNERESGGQKKHLCASMIQCDTSFRSAVASVSIG